MTSSPHAAHAHHLTRKVTSFCITWLFMGAKVIHTYGRPMWWEYTGGLFSASRRHRPWAWYMHIATCMLQYDCECALPVNSFVQQGYIYAVHDPYHVRMLSLPCVNLSPTCHSAPGRCDEARGEATHLRDYVYIHVRVYTSKAPIAYM